MIWFGPEEIPVDLDQIDWNFELDDSYWDVPRPTLEPWYLDQNYLDNLLKAYILEPNDDLCEFCGGFCHQNCWELTRGS